MKKKFILFCILILSIGIFITSKSGDNLLGVDLVDKIYYPFVWFLALVPLSFLGLLVNDQKYKFWIKFTGISFLVGMFFVLISPETARGIMLNPDKESVNWFFAGLYAFISIIYFIVQFIKNRRINRGY
jgi:hypothetical protein